MKLIDPTKLTLDPDPPRAPGTSLARTRARALRAWRRGARPELRVTLGDRTVTPDEVDWSKLPSESSTPGTPPTSSPRSVRLSDERKSRLAALADRWRVTENEAVGRAIDEAFSCPEQKTTR